MSGNNKSAYPFLIITGALVCLVALSQVNNVVTYLGFTSRPLDLLADLRPGATKNSPAALDSANIPPEIAAAMDSSAVDTATAAADTALATEMAAVPDPDHNIDFTAYGGIISYHLPPAVDSAAGGLQHLSRSADCAVDHNPFDDLRLTYAKHSFGRRYG